MKLVTGDSCTCICSLHCQWLYMSASPLSLEKVNEYKLGIKIKQCIDDNDDNTGDDYDDL